MTEYRIKIDFTIMCLRSGHNIDQTIYVDLPLNLKFNGYFNKNTGIINKFPDEFRSSFPVFFGGINKNCDTCKNYPMGEHFSKHVINRAKIIRPRNIKKYKYPLGIVLVKAPTIDF